MSKSSRQFSHQKQPVRQQPSAASFNLYPKGKTIESKNLEQLVARGRYYYQNNQLSQAIEYLTKSLYYDHKNSETNYLLGVAYLSVNQYSQSLKHLNVVSRFNPSFRSNLFLLMSIACKKMQNEQLAINMINRHIELNKDIEGIFYRAKLYFHFKRYEKSLENLEQIIQKSNIHLPSLFLKLQCLKKIAKQQQSLAFIAQYIDQVDVDQRIMLQIERASILSELDQCQQALDQIEAIQKLYISGEQVLSGEAQLLKAKLLQRLGKYNQSIVLYHELLSKDTTQRIYCGALVEISIFYMRQRDFYQAFTYLKRAFHIKIKSKLMQNLLRIAQGVTFLMKKKYGESMVLVGSVQLQLFQHLPTHQTFLLNLYYNSLAFGHFSLGNHQQALENYKKMNLSDESTDGAATKYNIFLCCGILQYRRNQMSSALQSFQNASKLMSRPEPFFYQAVILNEGFIRSGINTDNFIKILDIIQEGLHAGQSAHMYYYRSMVYVFLGMNSQALEDIDKAIQKSEDNIARYFHVRGVIFMLDKNYEQAVAQFGTALSIDEQLEQSIIEKAKCELLLGDSFSAFSTIQSVSNANYYKTYFNLYEKNYSNVLDVGCDNETVNQMCNFMCGKFDQAGPAGKLIIAIIYRNYEDVLQLLDEALDLKVSVGCLEINDLLLLKAYSEYKLNRFAEAIQSVTKVEFAIRQTPSDNYSQDDEKRLLLCKLNVILIKYKQNLDGQAISLVEQLLGEICEGPIYNQLDSLRHILIEDTGEHELNLMNDCEMISDYIASEQHGHLIFKFLLPFPVNRISQVQDPEYEELLTKFTVNDIQNKPQAPWIRRGKFGVIFTNHIQQYENLNLHTEENETSKSKLKDELKLGSDILGKLERIAKKSKDQQENKD